jgi:O-antigen/teichoic acid export membrane protein
MAGLKSLLSQTVVYGLPVILGRFLNYLLVPLYTGIFIPAEYGVVTKLYAIAAFVNVVLTFGMETTFFRFASQKNHNPEQVYATALNTVAILALLFFGFTNMNVDQIAQALKEGNHPEYIRWFSIILFFDALSAIPLAGLRFQNKAKEFATNRLINILSNILFNLFFLLLMPYLLKKGFGYISNIYKPEAGVLYIFVSNAISSFLSFVLLTKNLKALKSGIDFGIFPAMMRYSLPLLFVGFAGIVNETFDRVMLEYLLPEASAKHQVGVYGACYKLSIIMSLFIQAFRFAAEPFFFSQSAKKNAPTEYARVTHYFALFCLFIFLLVSFYLDYFKLFIRNTAYYEGLPVVPILLLANMFLGIYFNLSIWYKLSDKTLYGAYISVAAAFLTIVLNWVSIPSMGYLGAAYTTLFVYAVMCVAAYQFGKKIYPVPYKVNAFLSYLSFGLFLYLINLVLPQILGVLSLNMARGFMLMLFLFIVYHIEKPNKRINSQQK